jgi:hypothetical protein
MVMKITLLMEVSNIQKETFKLLFREHKEILKPN